MLGVHGEIRLARLRLTLFGEIDIGWRDWHRLEDGHCGFWAMRCRQVVSMSPSGANASALCRLRTARFVGLGIKSRYESVLRVDPWNEREAAAGLALRGYEAVSGLGERAPRPTHPEIWTPSADLPPPRNNGSMTNLKLAVIPGDGIGQEIVPEGIKALEAVIPSDVTLQYTEFDLGARRYHRTGEILTDTDLEVIDQHDAILLGAIGDPSVPSGVLERGLLLKLRFSLDHYVNLRPSHYYPGVPTPLANPGDIDFIVVREGTESLYAGNGGTLRKGTIHEVAQEISVNTAFGVERLVRYAFEQAAARPAHHLTLVHKHNVLVFAGGLWSRIVEEVGREYPQVRVDYCHIDAATIYMVTDPGRFDVIVTDNLFGDILTDEAGAVTGGVGLSASGNINPEGAHPSMFEPVHGSAPDIAGQGKADPTATIVSVALMLNHLGYAEQSRAIMDAIEEDMRNRAAANAAGDPLVRTTEQIGNDLVALIRR